MSSTKKKTTEIDFPRNKPITVANKYVLTLFGKNSGPVKTKPKNAIIAKIDIIQ
jgi:hypothetical protein